ncbi:hypothetical protein COV16_01445 [Candidatus Woesearchaeota archaeon CG10_big_fil_rev_8_21_14_0_10_34_8]|nr:MAG: hypothetical protein COV16_01445 [Candidatus Woesearchaeota archaeon CG10_big_fil_rev_8_21_14_0_10_34_8]
MGLTESDTFKEFAARATRLRALMSLVEKEVDKKHFKQSYTHLRRVQRLVAGGFLYPKDRTLVYLFNREKSFTQRTQNSAKKHKLLELEGEVEQEMKALVRNLPKAVELAKKLKKNPHAETPALESNLDAHIKALEKLVEKITARAETEEKFWVDETDEADNIQRELKIWKPHPSVEIKQVLQKDGKQAMWTKHKNNWRKCIVFPDWVEGVQKVYIIEKSDWYHVTGKGTHYLMRYNSISRKYLYWGNKAYDDVLDVVYNKSKKPYVLVRIGGNMQSNPRSAEAYLIDVDGSIFGTTIVLFRAKTGVDGTGRTTPLPLRKPIFDTNTSVILVWGRGDFEYRSGDHYTESILKNPHYYDPQTGGHIVQKMHSDGKLDIIADPIGYFRR